MIAPAPPVPVVPPPTPIVPKRPTLLPQQKSAAAPAADPRAPLQEGTALGEYTILSRLGQGGFGITYKARHSTRGTIIVIKEHMPEGLAVREAGSTYITYPTPESEALFQATLQEFTEEVTVLMGLQHPGIVPILDAFEANGTAYYAMPFVAGSALEIPPRATLNRERQAQEARRIKRLLMRLLDTLLYMEQHNVVHRDIKPENIRITPDGDPVLLDFGSARQLQPDHVYTNIYTPGFCAPEQALSGTDAELTAQLGAWTDIYSLGATFLYLITRMLPPRADMRLHANPDPYKPLAGRSSLVSLYGKPFLQAIDRALERRPDDRWQDAAAWRDSVEEAELPISPRLLRRARFLAAAGGISLTVLGGISLWALSERDHARELYGQSLRFSESILYDFNEELADIPGSTALQQQLGTRLKNYLDSIEKIPSGENNQLSRAVATAWLNLASVHLQQGRLEETTDALRKATEQEELLYAADPTDRRTRYELARTLLMRAEVARRRNLQEDARALTAKALTMLRKLCAEVPHNPDYRCALGRAMSSTANLARIDGNSELRKNALDEMLPLYRDLVSRYPEHEDSQVGLAYCLQHRAQYAMDAEDFANAAHLLDEEQRIFSRLNSEQPYRLSFKQGLASALYYTGILYTGLSESTTAAEEQAEYDTLALNAFNKHIEHARELEALDPHNAEYTYQQCRAMAYMADTLLRIGRPQETITTCETLRKKADELLATAPENTDYALLKAGAWRGLGRAHALDTTQQARAAEELTSYRELIREHLKKSPDNTALSFLYLDALSESATFALQNGDFGGALRRLNEAEHHLSELMRRHPNDSGLAKNIKRYRRQLQNIPGKREEAEKSAD